MVRILGRTASWEGSGTAHPWRVFFFWLRRGLGSVGANLSLFSHSSERLRRSREPFSSSEVGAEALRQQTLAGDPVKRRYGPKSEGSDFYALFYKACYIAPFT